ncbi:hypothetical protein CERZMDRAFT_84437 [Cercospora zeae-maydis SCOH1-5]|uniref:Uncharacterized protein n=1 Tax=Cercospora zeae-maydis SCOH1-5 TaxID=717836 RepID=A0A6A6FH85_9PEZI|nr:hypothetical protein CERZMDRAFT_84437 [Cercospora zeae-maydis SCOH1-5]
MGITELPKVGASDIGNIALCLEAQESQDSGKGKDSGTPQNSDPLPARPVETTYDMSDITDNRREVRRLKQLLGDDQMGKVANVESATVRVDMQQAIHLLEPGRGDPPLETILAA